LNVPAGDIRAESDDLRGGRPGVRITCRSSQGINVNALGDETRQLLSEME
jgi:hypothetical protein